MNEYLSHNKISFQEKDEPIFPFSIIISFLFSIILIISCTIKVPFSTPCFLIYTNGSFTFSWPLDKIDQIYQYKSLKVENTEIPFQIINFSEILLDESKMESYQKIEIKSPFEFRENQIIKAYFLDKKERIIVKIVKLLLEGG